MRFFNLLPILMAVAFVATAQSASAEAEDLGFSEQQTQRAVSTFNYGIQECAQLAVVYRVDCLRQTYSQTVRVIAKASVYWEAEVALTRVNRALYAFVRTNTDPNVGRERAAGGRIKAVTQQSLPVATELYVQGVDKAVAVLQSGSSVEVRYFAPIAEAIEASKSLLQ